LQKQTISTFISLIIPASRTKIILLPRSSSSKQSPSSIAILASYEREKKKQAFTYVAFPGFGGGVVFVASD
jgi:hypothetical protein